MHEGPLPSETREHLRLLAIFHWVAAGLTALFALVPVIHLVLGIAMLGGAFDDGRDAPPRAVGALFVGLAVVWMVAALVLALLLALAGSSISGRRNRTFCLIVAGIACLFAPLGTLLGIFSIYLLTKEPVAALFDRRPDLPGRVGTASI